MVLQAEGEFFKALRNTIAAPALTQIEVDGFQAILGAGPNQPISFMAYMLATAWHETNHTMQPVREAYWLSPEAATRYFFRMYDIQGQRPDVARRLGNIHPGDGAKYCGRGYPQTTGRSNYERAERELGLPFLSNPDLMLQSGPAAQVMISAMTKGWFTGRKLSDFLPRPGGFAQARRTVNGMDCAEDIADYARQMQAALVAGGWPV